MECAVLHLGNLRVTKGVLSTCHDVKMGPFDGVLSFPSPPEEVKDIYYSDGLLPPKNSELIIEKRQPYGLPAIKLLGINWGCTNYDSSDEEVWVNRLLLGLNVPKKLNESEMQTARGQYREWFRNLVNWFEIVTSQDLLHPTQKEGDGEFAMSFDGPFGFKTGRRLDFGRIKFLALEDCKHVLEKVSNGIQPTTSQLLLRDARRAFVEGNMRLVIVDASTSVESALTTLVSQTLESALGFNCASAILKRFESLGGRLRLIRSLGVTLPFSQKEIEDNLISLRNKVIHSAVFPSVLETKIMLDMSTEIVCAIEPIRERQN